MCDVCNLSFIDKDIEVRIESKGSVIKICPNCLVFNIEPKEFAEKIPLGQYKSQISGEDGAVRIVGSHNHSIYFVTPNEAGRILKFPSCLLSKKAGKYIRS